MEILFQNEYIQCLAIFFGVFILAKIFNFALVKYVKKITEKTETDLDDIMLEIITKPLRALIVFGGAYFGLKSLSVLIPYFFWLDKLFFVGVVLILSLIFSNIFSVFISTYLRVQKKFEKTPKLIARIVKITIYIIAILIILGHFNIEITPLLATLGVGGLAIGFALQSTLSNFFSGLHIISDRPIKIGDYIELEGGMAGYVEDIGWRSTRIRALPDKMVIIPNSKLAESIIINESMPRLEMSVKISCGVAYDSNLDKVEKVTLDVAKKIQNKIDGAVTEFEPFMRFYSFGDSNIDFSVFLRVKEPVAKYVVKHEFIKALKKRYDKEKIEISWPVRKIYKAN